MDPRNTIEDFFKLKISNDMQKGINFLPISELTIIDENNEQMLMHIQSK